MHNLQFQAIGTQWNITSVLIIDEVTIQDLTAYIEEFDKTYSRFRNDSLIHQIAHKAGEYTFPSSAEEIFSLYDDLFELTEGRVSPMVGSALEDLGYDADYSLTAKDKRPLLDYVQAISRSESVIKIDQPVVLDIGAVGKGYLVDQLCRLLDEAGYVDYVVDGSGDIRQKGVVPNIVGLEDPDNLQRIIGAVEVTNRALCASATNRRAWGDGMHHIIDMNTGLPVKSVVATWVVAETAFLADALATALFFSSPQTLAARYTYEYVRINTNGSVEYSDFFKGRLY